MHFLPPPPPYQPFFMTWVIPEVTQTTVMGKLC